MRWVRLLAKGVQNKDIQAGQLRHRLIGNGAGVGDIGRIAEAVRQNPHGAVQDIERLKLNSRDFHRISYFVQCNLRQAPSVIGRFEDIPEGFPDNR